MRGLIDLAVLLYALAAAGALLAQWRWTPRDWTIAEKAVAALAALALPAAILVVAVVHAAGEARWLLRRRNGA